MHLQRLQETGKPVGKLQTHFGLEGILSKHIFCSEEDFQFELLFHCLSSLVYTQPSHKR